MSPSTPHDRRHRHRLAAFGIVVLVVGVSVAWLSYQRIVRPPVPSAFYTPPDPLPDGPPGTIIRQEPVRAAVAGRRVWRILYTSTDPDDRPVAVSGVVVAPSGDAPAGGWPMVAWAHGTAGVAVPCAPSIVYPQAGLVRVPELAALLAAGTVVAITDYPGLGTPGPHPYLVGVSEGRAVLDSLRAARTLLGSQVSTTSVVYGHSQGGHAAVFADGLAPAYVPELHLAGVAAMAPPTDLAHLLDADVKEPDGIVLTSLAITSWSTFYPDTDPATVVAPLARPLVAGVGGRCVATTGEGLADVPEVAALQVRFLSADPATAPGWSSRLAENSPTGVSTGIPLLVAQGLADALVRPEVTEAFVQEACAVGAVVQLDTYAGVGHFALRTAAAPLVRDWLLARLQGAPAPPGCSTTPQPASS